MDRRSTPAVRSNPALTKSACSYFPKRREESSPGVCVRRDFLFHRVQGSGQLKEQQSYSVPAEGENEKPLQEAGLRWYRGRGIAQAGRNNHDASRAALRPRLRDSKGKKESLRRRL